MSHSSPLEAATTLSQALVGLVGHASAGVVALRAAPHRIVSGIHLGNQLVATASHALRRTEQIRVQTHSGEQVSGSLVGRDNSIDLAVVRLSEPLGDLNPLTAVDPATLRSGSLAAVVGLTVDAGPSASLGIVGAVGPARRTWRGGTLDQFLRLDVNLYPSQTGAAVVNAEGSLIGLATPALSRHSTIAVPASTLQRVATQLLEQGRIRHGYIGVGAQSVAIQRSVAERNNIRARSGLIVLNVEPSSPADQAGLQIGDILLTFGGQELDDVDALQAILRGDAIGRSTPVQILRGGDAITVQMTPVEREGARTR